MKKLLIGTFLLILGVPATSFCPPKLSFFVKSPLTLTLPQPACEAGEESLEDAQGAEPCQPIAAPQPLRFYRMSDMNAEPLGHELSYGDIGLQVQLGRRPGQSDIFSDSGPSAGAGELAGGNGAAGALIPNLMFALRVQAPRTPAAEMQDAAKSLNAAFASWIFINDERFVAAQPSIETFKESFSSLALNVFIDTIPSVFLDARSQQHLFRLKCVLLNQPTQRALEEVLAYAKANPGALGEDFGLITDSLELTLKTAAVNFIQGKEQSRAK
jgi:hypothetical protein